MLSGKHRIFVAVENAVTKAIYLVIYIPEGQLLFWFPVLFLVFF
jgi:hypothetical protein